MGEAQQAKENMFITVQKEGSYWEGLKYQEPFKSIFVSFRSPDNSGIGVHRIADTFWGIKAELGI